MSDISGTGARDTLAGTVGADVISGRDGSDTIHAGAGDDIVYGSGSADLDPASATIQAVRIASGLSSPVFGVSPPGDPDRLFVVEQHTGKILILDTNSGQVASTPFLDLPDSALAPGGEQGLLGLAFHPDYADNGRFFVYLTNAVGNIEVREYARGFDADHANPQSIPVLNFTHPFANHNAGWMAFGPDGMLYIASGDGGSADDPLNNGQNANTLLGKILRIDIDRDDFFADASRNYAIPADNPFANGPGADEVWALGLRNPWRASFDEATGALYIGDVGQGSREEVDVATVGGLNFGWRFKEGFENNTSFVPLGLTDPVLDYDHVTPRYSGSAITGGYVYHGPGGAQGLYIFGDFSSANLWTAKVVDGQAQDFLNRNDQLLVVGGDFDQLSSFAVDGRGRLYVIGLDGDIHRLTPGDSAGDASDYLRGDEGDDRIWGGLAFDDINGNMGDDTLSGGLGDDWVVGGKDNDRQAGDAGGDVVWGNLGRDTLDGGVGDDQVRGGMGDDVLTGGPGADYVSGDRGDDTVEGGAGADLIHGSQDAGIDRVLDFSLAEGDRVMLDPGTIYTLSQVGADTVIDMRDGNQMILVGVDLSTLPPGTIFLG